MNEPIKQGKSPEPVPFAVFECTSAHMNSTNKRLIWVIFFLILAFAISNYLWLRAWMSYDYVSDTVTVESKDTGNANYIGTSGSIYYGQNPSKNAETNPEGR